MFREHWNKTFVDFHNTKVSNGILDPKTMVIIQLGAAMAICC